MSKWSRIRNQHNNSIESYYKGMYHGLFSKREGEIIHVLRGCPNGLSDNQIRQRLGYRDCNAVRPRITELINEAGICEECGTVIDEETGKHVRVVRIIPEDYRNRQLEMFA